ncbi:ABC transporter ATP-binding protein, partial [Streptomyces scabiei]|nr:ABC transporter ATP-binding protein [Streptomyces scabiei]
AVPGAYRGGAPSALRSSAARGAPAGLPAPGVARVADRAVACSRGTAAASAAPAADLTKSEDAR